MKKNETKTATATAEVQTAPEMTAEATAIAIATATLADPKATRADKLYARFVIESDGMTATADLVEVAHKLNEEERKTAVLSVISGNTPKWDKILDGVLYPQFDPTAKESGMSFKALRMADVFGIKTNSKSIKLSLSAQPESLFAMLNVFGSNLCDSFHLSMESACTLKVFTKYTDAPKCFFSDDERKTDAKSNSQLESQLQTICNTIFGKDAVKIRKAHAVHLKAQFVKATAKDYRNGNEIALLQLVVNHAQDSKRGTNSYTHNSKLSAHKEPKKK